VARVDILPRGLLRAQNGRRINDYLFVFSFVGINPKNYTPPPVLGMITHGQRHKPRVYQRQRHKQRTCQSMLNILQVDRLARIPGFKDFRVL